MPATSNSVVGACGASDLVSKLPFKFHQGDYWLRPGQGSADLVDREGEHKVFLGSVVRSVLTSTEALDNGG